LISSIRKFWQRLENSVHPDDKPCFRGNKHTFNLDFPPPAYVGDVDNAPVVFLDANGGYCPQKTPAEFPRDRDLGEYIDWLRGERKELPENLSNYYTNHTLAGWLRDGTAVIVNAVAYRSPKITEEKENQKLAKILPSSKAHREWLANELLPAVEQNKRFVIVHRWKLWHLKRGCAESENFVYSPNPVSPYPAQRVLDQVRFWLDKR
jgi:hypothetical protein